MGKKDDNPAATGCAVVLTAVLLLVGGVNWVRDQLRVGHSVDGDDAVEAVDNAVHEAYSDEPWYERIESVKGGTLADLKIYTDFDASRQEDMKGAVAVCEAYAREIKSDNPYVLVYGRTPWSALARRSGHLPVVAVAGGPVPSQPSDPLSLPAQGRLGAS